MYVHLKTHSSLSSLLACMPQTGWRDRQSPSMPLSHKLNSENLESGFYCCLSLRSEDLRANFILTTYSVIGTGSEGQFNILLLLPELKLRDNILMEMLTVIKTGF